MLGDSLLKLQSIGPPKPCSKYFFKAPIVPWALLVKVIIAIIVIIVIIAIIVIIVLRVRIVIVPLGPPRHLQVSGTLAPRAARSEKGCRPPGETKIEIGRKGRSWGWLEQEKKSVCECV